MIQRQPLVVVVVVHSTLLLAILRTITYSTFLTMYTHTTSSHFPDLTPPLLPIPLTEVISSIPLRIPLLV